MHRLILHLGTHKTGSTALQQTLALPAINRALAADGCICKPYSWPQAQFRAVRAAASVEDAAAKWSTLETDFATVKRQLVTHDVLISWEGFSGGLFAGYADAGECARLLGLLTAGLEVQPVVYFRRQDSFIESAYAQSIHTGQTWSFDEYLATANIDGFDWIQWLTHYEQAWPGRKISVFAYEAQEASGGIVGHFLQAMGLATPRLLQDIERASSETLLSTNQGYAPEIIELARQVNASLDPEGQKVLRRLLQQTLRLTKPPFSAYQYFTPERRREILARFAASHAALRQRFPQAGFDLWDRPDPEPAPHADGNTQLVALLRLLVEQQMKLKSLAAPPSLRRVLRRWVNKLTSLFR